MLNRNLCAMRRFEKFSFQCSFLLSPNDEKRLVSLISRVYTRRQVVSSCSTKCSSLVEEMRGGGRKCFPDVCLGLVEPVSMCLYIVFMGDTHGTVGRTHWH